MKDKIPYDHSYKLLFSEPVMVKDLLLGFFGEAWVNELDFSTLERFNKEYVTENLRERESDIVWKVRWRGSVLYVLILIEFQSTIDSFMVVRMLSYVSLLYQDIIKDDASVRRTKQLPPVLPLILYAGETPWNAPLTFSELMDDNLPKLLKKYQPEFTCWLLDEGRCIIKGDIDPGNLVAPLIALEQSQQVGDASAAVNQLVKLLRSPNFDSLRRAYTVYLRRVLKARSKLPIGELNELYEVQKMLSERVDLWIKNAQEEGWASGMAKGMSEGISRGISQGISQGISEGISQGISQGELVIIKRLLTKRFGPLTACQITFLESKSEEELLDISEKLLDAKCIEEIM